MYEAYYGFTGKPFQLNPDPAFFFGSRGHRRAMAYLEYGLHQNEGFIVITGEIGAGKTTLVRSLLEKLDPSKVVAAQLVSTQIDADNILRLVAAAFGIPSRSLEKADLLLALEAFLVATTAAGKRALLIVDEAQNLTQGAVEELRMLSNFQLEDHSLLQSFLIGQPEFREMMQGPQMQQLRQRVIASYHLGPLDGEETKAYVEHRLSHVNRERQSPRIEAEAFHSIYAASGGIPRRINTLCDRLLLAGFLAEKKILGAEDVAAVVEELQEEHVAGGGGEAVVRPISGAATSRPAASLSLAGAALDPDIADRIAELAGGFDTQRFETRLANVEHTLSATLSLLNELVEKGHVKDKSGTA